ncbi:MAG: F0F1 ATP synthase subunit A [Gammaproteobacteria bacterium]|nr:F0F1 ATP synthase subunit A [Gammaproteobacteria bacterium]
MASGGGESAGEYITHHLTNWCVGCNPATNQPTGLVDMGAFNLDVILISVLIAAGLIALAWFMHRRWRVETPGRFQYSLEFIVEYIGDQVREVFPKANNYVGAMALTIFLWVFLMNAMDLIPIDLIPSIAGGIGQLFGIETVYFRDVPTATLDVPFAMAIVVFVLMIYYQLRANGLGGYVKRFLFHPYGKFGGPANVVTTLIDDLAKPVSLALRLFGNMFAGELIFALLAMLTLSAIQPFVWSHLWQIPAHFLAGVAWTMFDLLIATLQAFIFGVLAIVYLGMAQQTAEH